jgi:CDP-glucose 4,6-dehydratase
MISLKNKFKNKKIIITGHTGFKGSWLAFWLKILGAKIVGLSDEVLTYPSNFKVLGLDKLIDSRKVDIRDLEKVKKTIQSIKPDFIFHLAAQSLVKKSYDKPLKTFTTNSIGTLNILETLKFLKKKCTVILITSDKSYKNLEFKRGYKENDILGGHDPYSASKAAAELIIQSYIHSYFNKNTKILIGVARAGNVIGGGDWSENRLVPDCIKSWSKRKKVYLRNPLSTRPWQHVLEAVGGYLLFAVKLNSNPKLHGEVFNFGPNNKNNYSVINLVKTMKIKWKNVSWKILKNKKNKLYESKLLKLNSSKAKKIIKWKSILNFQDTTNMTINWYKKYYDFPKEIVDFTKNQIFSYQKKMTEKL